MGDSRPVYSTETGDLRKAQTREPEQSASLAGKGNVRVTLDTKGRRGKTVTLISNLQHNPQIRDRDDICGRIEVDCEVALIKDFTVYLLINRP